MLANTPKRVARGNLGIVVRVTIAQVRVPGILSIRCVRRARPVIGGTSFTAVIIPKLLIYAQSG